MLTSSPTTTNKTEHEVSYGVRRKILYIVTKSNFGGAQRYVFDLATSLDREKFEPIVAFGYGGTDRAGELSRRLIDAGIETIVIPELERDMSLTRDWASLSRLIGMLRDEKPDVVHVNSSKAGGLGALAARIAGVPRIIFTVHGLPALEDRSRFQRLLIAGATWLTCLLSHHVIAISKEIRDTLRKQPLLSNKVSLIYNGLSIIDFVDQNEARASLTQIDASLPREGTLIGTIAELHPNKDLATSLQSIARVPDVHFAVIGDGEKREELQREAERLRISPRVHFLGFIPNAPRLLKAFDVFLLSSIKEGLPYVLLEAGAAGVPVIATDISGVREIITHETTGLLVPTRNAPAIAEAIAHLVQSPHRAQSFADTLRKTVAADFTLERMARETTLLY